MNCIDCKWSIQLDEKEQCKKASPEVRECEGYENAKRKTTKLKSTN